MNGVRSLSGNTVEMPDVVVIDDDESIRAALSGLFRSVGLRARTYDGAEAFLDSGCAANAKCLILDVRLPGMGGLDLQATLRSLNILAPVIMITGYGDVPMSVRAMKAGAVDFLTKPFRDQDLLDAVAVALAREKRRREGVDALSTFKSRLGGLTPREREVLILIASGLMNKQIAAELERSEITVKMHRSQVMQKMGLRSVAQLSRIAEALGLTAPLGNVPKDDMRHGKHAS
jgi:FixJ family two-component response regulator